jgi:hypothetical protein
MERGKKREAGIKRGGIRGQLPRSICCRHCDCRHEYMDTENSTRPVVIGDSPSGILGDCSQTASIWMFLCAQVVVVLDYSTVMQIKSSNPTDSATFIMGKGRTSP